MKNILSSESRFLTKFTMSNVVFSSIKVECPRFTGKLTCNRYDGLNRASLASKITEVLATKIKTKFHSLIFGSMPMVHSQEEISFAILFRNLWNPTLIRPCKSSDA